jgi:hypothetical protein
MTIENRINHMKILLTLALTAVGLGLALIIYQVFVETCLDPDPNWVKKHPRVQSILKG